jgi:hypothetical protein
MNRRIALIIGAVALLLGAMGPWISALGGVLSVGPTQSVETSIVVFGGIALLILFAVLNRSHRILSVMVGSLVLIEAVFVLVRIQDAKSESGELGSLFSPGWGLYVTILTGVYLIVSTFIVKKSKTVTDSVPPLSRV